eukprot:9483086-Alexandrium_andersonii.AAC.1
MRPTACGLWNWGWGLGNEKYGLRPGPGACAFIKLPLLEPWWPRTAKRRNARFEARHRRAVETH